VFDFSRLSKKDKDLHTKKEREAVAKQLKEVCLHVHFLHWLSLPLCTMAHPRQHLKHSLRTT